MYQRFLGILLLAIFLAGCKTVEVYHFVHEETEIDRQSLQWSLANPELTSEITKINEPYFVVDFYKFWPGYSASAYLYVVQSNGDPVTLKSMEVSSKETGESLAVQLDLEAFPKRLENGLYLYRYQVLAAETSSKFSESNSLQVSLSWSQKGKSEKLATFELKKKIQSEVAWPT